MKAGFVKKKAYSILMNYSDKGHLRSLTLAQIFGTLQ